jgi:glycosyltransferase involved in cell wall biosynthesis
MAVRDGQPYVPEAIEGVLAQSFADFEFIIVDDASTDDTPEILRRYARHDSRIRVLRNPTSIGPYPSANRGLAEARGRFIARHDGDDVSPPARFEVQLAAAEAADDITLVTGAIESFGCEHQSHVKRPPSWQPRLEWELLFRNVVGAGAHVMFPRVIRGAAIRFPERYPYAEDYKLWCILSRLGRVACPEQIVYRHRQHPLSITCSRRTHQVDCLAAMRCEYQAEHLSSSVDREVSLAVSHFWNLSTERLVFANFQQVSATLTELRRRFLDYVRRRYGWKDGIALDTDIDYALRERLRHWLCRTGGLRLPELGGGIYQGMRVDRLRQV